MTDREMLEFAAKAAGITVSFDRTRRDWAWNSLDDDGDALRLAVKLGIHVMHSKHKVRAGRKLVQDGPCEEDKRPDPLAATRRAITRAAAEIGRNME
jgi:hypothetical protein